MKNQKIFNFKFLIFNLRRGFTLIELLVVISIIGILVSLGTVSYATVEKRARDTKRKSDLTQLKTALEAYYTVKNAYPLSLGGWRGSCPNSIGGVYGTTGPNGYIPDLAPTYIDELPLDPRNDQDYNSICFGTGWTTCYLYLSDGVDYKLLAHCGPESFSASDPFYDPVRPNHAWQVSSSAFWKNNR